MKIGCVILAGGRSLRMGTDKALLRIDEKSFIGRLCDTFSFFEERMIARGNREELADVNWPCISDVYPGCGPIGGLHGALSRCESDALFCAACDVPFMEKSVYDRLVLELTEETDVVIAVTEDGKHQPLCGIYRKDVARKMEEQILAGNNKIMNVLKKVNTRCVPVDSKKYGLYNINTPEEMIGFKG